MAPPKMEASALCWDASCEPMHEINAKSSREGSQLAVVMLVLEAVVLVGEEEPDDAPVEPVMGTQVISSSPSLSGSSLSI